VEGEEAPRVIEYVPSRQAVQDTVPTLELYSPASQSLHVEEEVAPMEDE